MPDGMQRLVEERAGQVEAEQHLAALVLFDDGRVERAEKARIAVVAEMDAVSGRDALARPHEGQPAIRRDAHVQRRIDLRRCVAAPADARQLRRNDLGVVEDQHIAGIEQRRQVANRPILEVARPA